MLRTKSETRRQAIVETAAQAFRERGFDATSMSDIAVRVGGSKATLYNYFASKEALFLAVMHHAVKAQAQPLVEAFCASPTVEEAIRKIAPDYIRLMLRPEVMAVTRMCVAEGERGGFGPALYEEGPKPAWCRLAARIEAAMDTGELRRADPMLAAQHMMALCEAGPVHNRMRGWVPHPTEAEIQAAGEAAADVFLRAYMA
jgi:AcrR family transcriptional regulator